MIEIEKIGVQINVRVSKEMKKLSDILTMLNKFVWTSEITNLYTFDRVGIEFNTCLKEMVHEKLKDLRTEAWTLNNQGSKKYECSLEQLLEDIKNKHL